MPGFIPVVTLCLRLANMSVALYLLIAGNPLLETGISLIATLIGSATGLAIGWWFFFDHLLPALLGP